MSEEMARQWSADLASLPPAEILRWCAASFEPGSCAFATSFGTEDQIITDIMVAEKLSFPLFTIDTGRLPQETHDVHQATRERYGLKIDVLFPDAAAITDMVSYYGPNLFYEHVELRKLCCQQRKVEPLKRKLATLKGWICGLRRAQSVTRREVDPVEWDASFGLFKINPLAAVSDCWLNGYITEHDIPLNALHAQGYPSIGCAPCTRAIKPGEDIRAGRWWWELPEKRECGLHLHQQETGKQGNN